MSEEPTEKPRKYPFSKMRIQSTELLDTVKTRSRCQKCQGSRMFFCYTCYIPMETIDGQLPKIQLPIKIDIIKHKKEIDGKSTAVHAAVLAGHDITIYTYPNIPDYSNSEDCVLIFPTPNSLTVSSLFQNHTSYQFKENFGLTKGYSMGTLLKQNLMEIVTEEDKEKLEKDSEDVVYTYENLPIKKAIFIDSTWNQCRGIFKDPKINSLKKVIIQNRLTQFWRHQKDSPRWYLSTIEAIHQFLMELHISAWGLNKEYLECLENLELKTDFIPVSKIIEGSVDDFGSLKPYNGQYDNLLFFFTHMYDMIHRFYDHNKLLSYKRPI